MLMTVQLFVQERLLAAIATRENRLSEEERKRNQHGPHLLFETAETAQGMLQSSLPDVFPSIQENRARLGFNEGKTEVSRVGV